MATNGMGAAERLWGLGVCAASRRAGRCASLLVGTGYRTGSTQQVSALRCSCAGRLLVLRSFFGAGSRACDSRSWCRFGTALAGLMP